MGDPTVKSNIRKHVELAAIIDSIWAKAEQYLNKDFCHITENNAELEKNLKSWFSGKELKTLTDLMAHAQGDLLAGDWSHPINDLEDALKVVEKVSGAHVAYSSLTTTKSTKTTLVVVSAATQSGKMCWITGMVFFMMQRN